MHGTIGVRWLLIIMGPVNLTHGRYHLTMVKKISMGWESKKWPVKAIPNNPLVKENSFSCLGGFTFKAKA